MTILVKLVADYAIWLYVLLVLVALLFLRAYVVARRERDNSIFTMERESAAGRMAQTTMGLLVTLTMFFAFPFILPGCYISKVLVVSKGLTFTSPVFVSEMSPA